MTEPLHIDLRSEDVGPEHCRHTAVFGLLLDHVVWEGQDGPSIAEERLASQLRAQIDLIRSFVRTGTAMTLALRYLTLDSPNPDSKRSIAVVLLVRVADVSVQAAEEGARALGSQLQKILRVITPDHVWRAISNRDEFAAVWQPFDWGRASVAEIRRREDLVRLFAAERDTESPAASAGDRVYMVKPFAPRLTSMSRILHLMMIHPSPLVFQVALAPTQLFEHESQRLPQELVTCWPGVPATAVPWRLADGPDASERFLSSYAQAIELMLMNQWLRLQGTPVLMAISVASPDPVPEMIAQMIGVDLTRPPGEEADFARISGTLLRGDFDVVVPENDADLTAARQNAGELSFRPWGRSPAPQELRRLRNLVDPVEAASAFRFPVPVDGGLPGLRVATSRVRAIDTTTMEAMQNIPAGHRTRLGVASSLDREVFVFLSQDERRQHVYIAGQTGTGKTTLLKTMILSDIEAGRGVAVIDPHGDLFSDLLALIPPSRADDVVVLDPTDIEFPVGLNLLEAPDDASRWHIVREMRAIMDRLLADQYGASNQFAGPLFFQHMQMNMLLAMSDPGSPGTLLEFHRIFQQAKYWRRWLPLKWNDPQLKVWVETMLPNTDYMSRSRGDASMGEYIGSKFDEFVFDPRLRLIFGQKRSTIDLDKILGTGKILLVNLSKGALSEANSRFLGMILMGQIQAAVLRRVCLPQDKRRTFCVYVDEFQNLATENFGLLLSEARKFGVCLTLANQFTSQIRSRGLLDAVLGNVGNLISFRVGRDDQSILKSYFGDNINLTGLPNRQAMVRTAIVGHVAGPFTLRTELPSRAPDPSVAKSIRDASQKRFGRPRSQVLAEIESSLLNAESRIQQ